MSKNGKSSLPTVKKPRAAAVRPTREEIALRAYQIYLERSGAPGNALEDWTRAERELLEESGKPRLRLRAPGQPREFRYVPTRPRHHGRLGFCFHRWRAHLCSLPGIRALKATGCPHGSKSTLSLVVADGLGLAPGGKPK